MKDPSYILTDNQLLNIKLDARNQLRDGELDWREIRVTDFIDWYLDRLARQLPDETPLSDFDVLSIQGMFEDWVKES